MRMSKRDCLKCMGYYNMLGDEKQTICCMFDNERAEAVRYNHLMRIKAFDKWSRREKVLYQCRKCGAYVVYTYEEIAYLYGGWDNADIFECYYPSKVIQFDTDQNDDIKWEIIDGAKYIYGHNLEFDKVYQYCYRSD